MSRPAPDGSRSRRGTLLALSAAILIAGGLLLPVPRARAEEEQPPAEEEPYRLEKHPFADARPGEYLRYVEDASGWKKWFVERIVDVRERDDAVEVLWEIVQTDEEGTRDLAVVRGSWVKVPEFKAAEHQRILKDEMQVLEVAGQEVRCRYLYIEEQTNPPFPEPKRRRQVWYSNDVPCSGKVMERPGGRELLGWGMLTDEELRKRQEAYKHLREGEDGDGDEE